MIACGAVERVPATRLRRPVQKYRTRSRAARTGTLRRHVHTVTRRRTVGLSAVVTGGALRLFDMGRESAAAPPLEQHLAVSDHYAPALPPRTPPATTTTMRAQCVDTCAQRSG